MSVNSYNEDIFKMMSTYKEDEVAIEVSFRNIVKGLNSPDRVTHLIHPYPAKLLAHIPHFFLNNEVLSKKNDIVLDPFCGSGTVLLEGMLAERNSLGVDANPLARLISKVKTQKFNVFRLKKTLNNIKKNYSVGDDKFIPSVVNIDHWYSKDVQKKLASLLHTIKETADPNTVDFFMLCFSVCARKVSLADPKISVPVKLKSGQYNNSPFEQKVEILLKDLVDSDVIKKYVDITENNIKRVTKFNNEVSNGFAKIISDDARSITSKLGSKRKLAESTVDIVVTSPPYAGAQKYIRASSLNLCWTELSSAADLRELNSLNIGRETYYATEYKDFLHTGIDDADEMLSQIHKLYPQRAHIASNYLREMEQCFKEIYRVVKKDGFLVLVAANNQICGQEFKTQYYLKEMCKKIGFKVELELIDDIHSYGLMTKRNKTASIITREWVTVFKRM